MVMLSSGSTEIWFQPELPGLYTLHQEMVIFGIFSNFFVKYPPTTSGSSPKCDILEGWQKHVCLPFMLLSASVNSISSIPSPVYQCKNALRRNIDVNCSLTRFHTSWIAVVLPTKVDAILRPFGGMSQIDAFTLFGIPH